MAELTPSIEALQKRGVHIPHPESVFLSDDVNPDHIAAGVVLHPGTRLTGAALSIGPDSEIGGEAPMTLINCQLGHRVKLKGGYAERTVFMDDASGGSGMHVRAGCILEEQASIAHSVGLKQTILMPYVTLGSLINFCDCLMAGGTSRTNHSEVGSSYIHFNFTPHGDKATPSLIGDVPSGVLLNQPPIFLGGQGGLVGPARIGYGVVLAAGSIQRGDALASGHLYRSGVEQASEPVPYPLEAYRSIRRIVKNNLVYIGNLLALKDWYEVVRKPLMLDDQYHQACWAGAQSSLELLLTERIKRLAQVAEKMPASIAAIEAMPSSAATARALAEQRSFAASWENMQAVLMQTLDGAHGDETARLAFTSAWQMSSKASDYLTLVHALSDTARQAAARWLQSIVDQAATHANVFDTAETE